MSGKGQFPFMVDPNTGKQMLESDAIISYLWNEYGNGQVLSSHLTKAIEALHANAFVILIGDVTVQFSPTEATGKAGEAIAWRAVF